MKDYKYKLIELKDSMNDSIVNVIKVIDQQETLLNVIENSDKNEFFKNFKDELKKSTDNLKEQVTVMSNRYEKLADVLDNINDNNYEIIDNLLLSIGFIKEDE